MINVVCTKCGWTHFAVSKVEAWKEIKSFNEYFDRLSKKDQDECYGGNRSTIENYRCYCGSQKFKLGNTAPDGCTIGPVIYEPDKENEE